METWKNVTPTEPKDNVDVLVYTDTEQMKVARRHKGIWNTYMNVVQWTELPNKPQCNKEPAKRGRKKKS